MDSEVQVEQTVETLPGAGRELDALVAERAFGYQWFTFARQSYLVPPEWVETLRRPGLGWQPGIHGARDIDFESMPSYRDLRPPKFSAGARLGEIWDRWIDNGLLFQTGYDDGQDSVLGSGGKPTGFWCQVYDKSGAHYAEVGGCASLEVAVCQAAVLASEELENDH